MKNVLFNSVKALLFDMDGVLIDSMPYHVSAWQQIFAQQGVEIPSKVLRRSEGEKAKITIKKLAREHGIDWNDDQLEELVEKKRQIYRQSAPRGLRPLARKILDYCHSNNLKTAIVTGSVRPNLEWTLSPEERSLFNVIISSEQYTQGKPHPEPFLKAAEELEVDPADCLVIENAPLGIQSAKAAGMKCLAIATTLPPEDLSEADMVVPDIDRLPDLLDSKANNNKRGGN